ncbi:MAG: DUF4332 domain-containing protein [Anaerolineae bacterium]|jgi:hypothetical protein
MEEGFRRFLKRGGRSSSAVRRVIRYVGEFSRYLEDRFGKGLDEATPEDLEAFVAAVEREPKACAKGHLWGIRYYYEYVPNEEMRQLAGVLREERIERRPFALKDFRGVDPETVEKLGAAGIRNVKQMLEAARTRAGRAGLAEETGLPVEVILELVKLAGLARIPGIKGIRARLYHDAGVDTIDKMAAWDPEDLREMVAEFVERTGFDGIAPLPAEARFSVARARSLPKIVEY